MSDNNSHPSTEPKAPQPNWPLPPFDAATNFSLLGWILDKLMPGRKSEKKVDLKLDEQTPEPDTDSGAGINSA